jgi:SAM-dependent methyltransferase
MTAIFDKYATYYNALYKDKPYEHEAIYIQKLISEHSLEATTLLELGSGTGKHAFLLNKFGYQVAGVDQSEEMLSQIQSTEGVSFHLGDIRNINLERSFDVVLSLFHVMSYMNSDEDFLRVLENAKRHLSPGGLFIFDVWYAPAVLNLKPETRTKRIQTEDEEILRVTESELNTLKSSVQVHFSVFLTNRLSGEIDFFEENHSMRYFTANEIGLLAKLAGFEIIASEEFQTGKELDETTWGACFVLRASNDLLMN